MKNAHQSILWMLVGVMLGALAVLTLGRWGLLPDGTDSATSMAEQAEPLYWVAPMDPNYRRDQPGKSPMGMDLVPVYADAQNGDVAVPGTVRISPDVVNNLGVRTGVARLQPLHDAIQTVGYVRFDEDKLIHIHPRVEGWVEKLYVKAEGDPVNKRQPLYDLYSPALVNAQEEMVLALQRDSPRLIEAAEARLKALQLPSSAIVRLRQSRRVRQTITFYAPQSGVLDNLAIREGFYVQPGTTLMSIGALDEVWVEAEVFERQAAQVKAGAAVTMTLDYLPSRRWEGSVDYVYPALDQSTRTVKVRMRFANDDLALKPNMFAQVSIQNPDDHPTLVIPREALIRTGSMDRVVLSLGEGRFRAVAVATGRSDDRTVEILRGLQAGDVVVTSAQFLIDSESSKTAGLQRIDHRAEQAVPDSVWVAAAITDVMPDHRMVTLRLGPVEAWQWPAGTRDFTVDAAVAMADLEEGAELHLQLRRESNDAALVTAVHVPQSEQGEAPATVEEVNHDAHQ